MEPPSATTAVADSVTVVASASSLTAVDAVLEVLRDSNLPPVVAVILAVTVWLPWA